MLSTRGGRWVEDKTLKVETSVNQFSLTCKVVLLLCKGGVEGGGKDPCNLVCSVIVNDNIIIMITSNRGSL